MIRNMFRIVAIGFFTTATLASKDQTAFAQRHRKRDRHHFRKVHRPFLKRSVVAYLENVWTRLRAAHGRAVATKSHFWPQNWAIKA